MRASSRQSGLTLIEVMVSLATVLVGMMALFRVISVSSRGSATAQRMTQAQARVQQVMEAMQAQPRPVLDCLTQRTSDQWAACELQCQAARGMAPLAAEGCVFATLATSRQDRDNTQQQYAIVYDPNGPASAPLAAPFTDRSTWVRAINQRLYQAQVTVGWRDDGTAGPPYDHRVSLRTNIYRNVQ